MKYDLEKAAQILAERLPGDHPVVRLRAMTTGFSNDTYVIEGPGLILRLPPAAGAMLEGHDVVGQARIYQALGETPGAPLVPKIVLIEDDPAVLGAPFFVMSRVAGESIDDMVMAPWFVDGSDELRRKICTDWIAAFASLSKLKPLAPLGPPVSSEDYIRTWREFARNADCPKLVTMFDRLLAVPAPISGAPAVVQGDPKLSNIMWLDQHITAVLDWEMALNGDPLADLGYILFFFASDFHSATRAQKLPGMLTRDEVIALWQSVSGRSADGVYWHEIAQIGKTAAIIAEGVNMANTGRSDDPRLEVFKLNIGYYLDAMAAMLDGCGL